MVIVGLGWQISGNFMDFSPEHRFSGPVAIFHDRRLPEAATPVGYAALIDAFALEVPLPTRLSAIGPKHRVYESDGWRVFSPRHAPDPTIEAHLVFSLKYEGLDLAVLRRIFMATGPAPIVSMIQEKSTGSYARRLWFLYEWLLDVRLPIDDATRGSYFLVVDPEQQFATGGVLSSRHRVRNNLPGTRDFCPLVFRTDHLEALMTRDLKTEAIKAVDAVPKDVIARAAAFLLLKDSKASYAIEGEQPPQRRIERWGKAIGEAGRKPLDLNDVLRLQRMVIEDSRFVKMGLRVEDGFVGTHDRETMAPLPDHISARHGDLNRLMQGLIDFAQGPAKELDAVLAAAILAFGFAYIHPLADGNGRLHRYLIHHVLSEGGFNPPGIVFPVSAVMLDRIDDYRKVLESYSARLLPLIEWEATPKNNVRVRNDTLDFYRYFDATAHAEFLYECVARTIDIDLPREALFLKRHDLWHAEVTGIIEMPERTIDLLFRFLQQNNGKLSKRARNNEFAALRSEEVVAIEEIYQCNFPSGDRTALQE